MLVCTAMFVVVLLGFGVLAVVGGCWGWCCCHFMGSAVVDFLFVCFLGGGMFFSLSRLRGRVVVSVGVSV